VARELAAAGLAVPCFLVTRAEHVDLAARELREWAGLQPRGYASLDEMLGREQLDALAILSPSESHEGYLAIAAEAGLHVLCEKPLLWGGSQLLQRAHQRIEALRRRGLLLVENCQWPQVLESYRALFPAAPRVPRRFAMHLAPSSRGRQILGDCLPHPLSLLQALVPQGRVEAAEVGASPDGSRVEVRFDFVAGSHRIRSALDLRQGHGVPRSAWLELDGLRAQRRIRLPGYRMSLADGRRSVPLPDPLACHLRAFARQLQAVCGGTAAPDPEPLARRMAMLETLLVAYDRLERGGVFAPAQGGES